jgi:serine/threonine protein phosphatase PrpC
MSTKAIATTKGSRSENEDYELVLDNDKFSVVLMLDGHRGDDMKSAFGEKLKEKLESFIDVTNENEEFLTVSNTLKEIYYSTLEYIDTLFLEAGTTMSLGVFQKYTRNFFSLQVGDSAVFIADTESGEIINGTKLFYQDDTMPEKEFEMELGKCITTTHDFTVEDEINLYLNFCREHNLSISIKRRNSATRFENRYLAQVNSIYLPEPSRTIEPITYYKKYDLDQLIDIQRTPEITVWNIDQDYQNLALCAVCDGFVSKKALPTFDKVSQVLLNPGRYIQEAGLLDGTLIGNWLETKNWWGKDYIKPSHESWNLDPILYANKLVHKIVPDKLWKDAVQESINKIEEIRNRIPPDEIRACLNLQDCVDMAVQIPISIASDDNVSCCVVLL